MRTLKLAAVLMIGFATSGKGADEVGHAYFKFRLAINPSDRRTIPDAVVEVAGGRILAVGGAVEVPIPPGANVVDFGDKYVIPGLVDTHGHLYTRTGREWRKTNHLLPAFYLAAGVTTVGTPGSMDFAGDVALRDKIDSGEIPGPRFFLAGEYIQMTPKVIPWIKTLETADEARALVDDAARHGATAIKLYDHVQGDVMRAAIARAHDRSMRVWAHVGSVTYQEAIDMGVDQIFHGVLDMPDGRKPGVAETDYAARMRETGKIDLEARSIQKMFRAAASRRVVLTPTAVVAEARWAGEVKGHRMEEQERFYTPESWKSVQRYIKGPLPAGYSAEDSARERAKNQEFIRLAHQSGCLLSTGTDYVLLTTLPGWSLWRETEIFAEAGLPPMDILKAATWNGAYALGRTDQLGSLEPGKMADFVILDANPLEDIANLRRVHRVVKAGIIYDREALLRPLVGKVD
jgi:imidazolonepropionase-like amidohydrolase